MHSKVEEFMATLSFGVVKVRWLAATTHLAVHQGRAMIQVTIANRETPVCSQLLILRFAATDFLHRTVQILVTIYMGDSDCLIPLNNIEQTATKTEQPKEPSCSANKSW